MPERSGERDCRVGCRVRQLSTYCFYYWTERAQHAAATRGTLPFVITVASRETHAEDFASSLLVRFDGASMKTSLRELIHDFRLKIARRVFVQDKLARAADVAH